MTKKQIDARAFQRGLDWMQRNPDGPRPGESGAAFAYRRTMAMLEVIQLDTGANVIDFEDAQLRRSRSTHDPR